MSPDKAFKAIKLLFPTAKSMAIAFEKRNVTIKTESGQKGIELDEEIDWPFGVSEWPPRDEEWRDATIADTGKATYIPDRFQIGVDKEGSPIYMNVMLCGIIKEVRTVCCVHYLDGTHYDRAAGFKVPIASTRAELKSRIDSLVVEIANAEKMLASLDSVESLA